MSIVIVGIVLVGMIKWGQALFRFGNIRAIIFGCILEMFAGGYLFTYLQGIVHSTAAGDRELPDLPGISNFLEDVILPFFRLLGLTVFFIALTVRLFPRIEADATRIERAEKNLEKMKYVNQAKGEAIKAARERIKAKDGDRNAMLAKMRVSICE